MMRTKNRSQIAIEFLMLISFLSIMSLGFIVAAGIKMKEFSDATRREQISDFGLSLKKEIDIASVVKEGYIREIILPDLLDGTIDYNITTMNSSLIISTEGYEFTSIIAHTTGSLTKGSNIITKVNSSIVIQHG